MRRFRISTVIFGVCGTLLLAAPSHAQDWAGGWVPVYEDYARGWGSNRPFWWSDLGPTPYWGGTSFDRDLGWPYNTWYGPAETYTYRVAPVRPYDGVVRAPVVSARSVASGRVGSHCSTPAKTCSLRHSASLGGDCSCKVTGAATRGVVVP